MSAKPGNATADDRRSIEDVWSRTEPKYRRRAIVLLIINVCLFAGLGSVAYWLRTGVVFAPRVEGYAEQLANTFNPTTNNEHTPTGLSLGPISVRQVPMMIPVLGLILAALVSIPILVTMLYRITCALPFVAVVGFIAVMPWLAIALLASCLLVSLSPLRFRSRFASCLLSLLPVVLYFFMASRQESAAVDALADPADRVKLLAPLIVAMIASAVVMGIALIIARIVNYRPGVIAPLLAALFLTPAALFEFQVGRDELHYRLLEREFGPGSEYFVSEQIGDAFEMAVDRAVAEKTNDHASYEAVRAAVELKWLFALDADADLLFTAYQDRAALAADRFLRLFPDSCYAPCALFIQGRALDMRVNLNRFREKHELAFYDDFPNARSRRCWQLIESSFPNSSTAADALLRLATLDVRGGRVDDAIARLESLEKAFGSSDPPADDPVAGTPMDALMQRESAEESLAIVVGQKAPAGRRLSQLLQRNRDPLWGDDPLVSMMQLDPQSTFYAHNLRGILDRYPACQLADNIELAIALAHRSASERIESLERCVAEHSDGDAWCASLYELGLAHQTHRSMPKARESYDRVVNTCGDSVWPEQARARLRQLDRVTADGV